MKKHLLFALALMVTNLSLFAQYPQTFNYTDNNFANQVNVGTGAKQSTHPSAWFEVGPKTNNSTKGVLLPRGDRNQVANPTLGLTIYDINAKKYYQYNGTAWELVGGSEYGDENVRDAMAAAILNSSSITWAFDDAANTITASVPASTFAPFSGGGNYIQNQNTTGQAANYWINGTSKAAIYQAVGTVTASGGLAVGSTYYNNLVATANNDILLAADFQPTFSLGSFTGVQQYAMRTSSLIIGTGFPGQANVTGALNIVTPTGKGITIQATGATTSSNLLFVNSANAAVGFFADHTNKTLNWAESGNGYGLSISPSIASGKGFKIYYGYGTAGLYSSYVNWPTNGDASTRWGFNQSTPGATVDVNGNLKVAGTWYGTAASPNTTTPFKAVDISPTINQYTGSTAPIYGVYYNPTLTSLLGPHFSSYAVSGMTKVGSETAQPSGGENGALFYNTTANAFQVYQAGAWASLLNENTGIKNQTASLQTAGMWINGLAGFGNTQPTSSIPFIVNTGSNGSARFQLTNGAVAVNNANSAAFAVNQTWEQGTDVIGRISVFTFNNATGYTSTWGGNVKGYGIGTAVFTSNGLGIGTWGAFQPTAADIIFDVQTAALNPNAIMFQLHTSQVPFYIRKDATTVQGSLTAAPSTSVNGAQFYNSTANRFEVYQAGAWKYNMIELTTVPTSTADAMGATGDMAADDGFLYRKTSTGWKRAALATF